jgi:hypothetical protein
MRRNRAAAICLPILLGAIAPAHANGALAEFPAGGVVFKPAKDISIAREDLEIGWDRIRVRYVFESSASEARQETIGFPLAKVPQDDSPDGFQDDDRNYMGFEVSVDGKPLSSTPHEYAWLGEINITAKLKEMGVPVFAATPEAFEALAHLPEATIARLKQEELVDEDGEWLIPRWSYQAVHEWTQTFAPGQTEVEISYAPRFGATNEYATYYPGGEGAKDYCLDETVKQKLSGDAQPQPFTVGYILTTARNWNGPIGEFNLKIANTDSFASLCVPDGLTAAGDGWSGRDFVPKDDLKVLFFYGGS